MTVEITIVDADLLGFSDPAKGHLKVAVSRYAVDLIRETNRVESDRNRSGGQPEITQGMVDDADTVMRRGVRSVRTNIWIKVLRIVSAVAALLVGVMYDQERMQDGLYLLAFVAVIAVTIITVTISTLKE